MADVPTAVASYVAGGELAMREKRSSPAYCNRSASLLTPELPYSRPISIFSPNSRPVFFTGLPRWPTFYDTRSTSITATVAGETATVGSAFGSQVRPVAAKLLADVCGYLVTTAGIRPEFRSLAHDRLVVDLTGGDRVPRPRPDDVAEGAALLPAGPAVQDSLPLGKPGSTGELPNDKTR